MKTAGPAIRSAVFALRFTAHTSLIVIVEVAWHILNQMFVKVNLSWFQCPKTFDAKTMPLPGRGACVYPLHSCTHIHNSFAAWGDNRDAHSFRSEVPPALSGLPARSAIPCSVTTTATSCSGWSTWETIGTMQEIKPFLARDSVAKMLILPLRAKSPLPPNPFIILVPMMWVELTLPYKSTSMGVLSAITPKRRMTSGWLETSLGRMTIRLQESSI